MFPEYNHKKTVGVLLNETREENIGKYKHKRYKVSQMRYRKVV